MEGFLGPYQSFTRVVIVTLVRARHHQKVKVLLLIMTLVNRVCFLGAYQSPTRVAIVTLARAWHPQKVPLLIMTLVHRT